jgi:hypothetical protein
MLTEPETLLPDPFEPPLPVDPEQIRVIAPDQPNDLAGYNAMQPLEQSPEMPGYYLLSLPDYLAPDDPELFGFFVYELRVAHDKIRWCTAQARYGAPLRVAGVQHPPPPLRSMVARTRDFVSVVSPYARAVLDGRNLRARVPRSQMHALLYAQVMQADGQSWRNVLISRSQGAPLPLDPHGLEEPRLVPALAVFQQDSVVAILSALGLPLDSSLSIVSVEMLPENLDAVPGMFQRPFVTEPLGVGLGHVRILRTSALTPVPAICPPAA